MKVMLESTDRCVQLECAGGVMPARLWVGATDTGITVHVYVTRISPQTDDPAVNELFGRELQATRTPDVQLGPIPLRLIL